MPSMSLSHKMKLFSNYLYTGRLREIYNILFWVYPYWWNKKTAKLLLNKIYPKIGIDLFPPFLEIEPTTVCNFRCVCCVPKNEMILTDTPEYIQDVKIKDNVYVRGGLKQDVKETFSRKYSGNLIEIKAEGVLPIKVTPEHRILVSKKTFKQSPKSDRKNIYSKKLEFIEAEKLDNTYALVFPKLKNNKKILDINGLKIKPELLRFLGIYIAEGYVVTSKRKSKGKVIGNHGTIRLCFGKHEIKLINETCELIKKIFNKNPNVIVRDTTTDVQFFSVNIAKWLSEFGKKATEKVVPSFIFDLDEELVKSFLDGFIEGDGYTNEKYLQLTTSSKVLALQLQKLLSKIDVFGRLYVNNRKGVSYIQGRKVNINDLYNLRITSTDYYKYLQIENIAKKRVYYGFDKDNFYLPIRSKSKKKYSGYVYNLETNDKSFELNNVIIHNCEHTFWKEPSQNMDFKKFKKIFDQFGPHPKWLGLTGIGSSYLNKDFHKMISYAKSKGTIVEVMDHFAHFKNDDQIKELLEIGPDFQFISTYGASKESFESVCVGSDYDKVMHNIRTYFKLKKQMKKRFPITSFHYIVTSKSKHEVFDFLEFVASLNTELGEVLVTPMLHDFKEAKKFAVNLEPEYIDKIREKAEQLNIAVTVNMIAYKEAEKLSQKPPFDNCKEYIMPFVFVTGHVSVCCSINEANQRELLKKNSPGNLFDKNLMDVWYSPQYKRIRKMIRNNQCPVECALCPAYYTKNMPKVEGYDTDRSHLLQCATCPVANLNEKKR